MSAGMSTVAPAVKRPRVEPKKLGTLTEAEAFWHPIILASFAGVCLFVALAHWASIVVSALLTLAVGLAGAAAVSLAALAAKPAKAAAGKRRALDGLQRAVASRDPQNIRAAIGRAEAMGVTVQEASAVKEVRAALGSAGARLRTCAVGASKAAAPAPQEHTASRHCAAETPATVAGISAAVSSDLVPQVSDSTAPSVPHVPVESTQRIGRKRAQEVWFDGDVVPWILL